MISVVVGRVAGDHVEIDVGGWEHPGTNDFDDGNWLMTRVGIRARGFSGRYAASLRAEEFVDFLDAVRRLSETLDGEAVFTTMEEQLRVAIRRVGSLGGLEVVGVALDAAGWGNRLVFKLAEFDQSDLPPLVAQLEALVEAFPVIGRDSTA